MLWPELEAFLQQAGVGLGSWGNSGRAWAGLVHRAAGGHCRRSRAGPGLGIPVAGVDTLEAVARRHQGPVTVIQRTRNALCYAACYVVEGSQVQVTQPPHRARFDEVVPTGLLTIDEPPSGQALAALGLAALKARPGQVEPLYL